MQLFGFFGVVALVSLMWLGGFQIVPENSIGRSASASSTGSFTLVNAPLIQPSGRSTSVSVPQSGIDTSAVGETVTVVIPQVPVVTVLATQNIEDDSALLRGEILVGTEILGSVFFMYGYNQRDLDRSLGSNRTLAAVQEDLEETIFVKTVASSLSRDRAVSSRVSRIAPDTTYYLRLCAEKAAGGLTCSRTTSFTTIPGAYRPGDVQVPTLRLYDETSTDPKEMIIDVQIAMRDTVDGDVYLVYGESQSQVSDALYESYSDIDEDDELLQKTRLARGVRGTLRLQELLEDLEDETKHYYFVCVEYDGLREGTVCTRIQSFDTYNEDYGSTPWVQTAAVVSAGEIARISGSVRMRDFGDGKVFFVYGTDVRRISALGGETTMERISQSKDRLQRVLVDYDLDSSDDYDVLISDLQLEEEYAARLCVEYRNQNENYRDVQFVQCGEVKEFTVR